MSFNDSATLRGQAAVQACRVCWDVGKVPMRNSEGKLTELGSVATHPVRMPDAMMGIVSECREQLARRDSDGGAVTETENQETQLEAVSS